MQLSLSQIGKKNLFFACSVFLSSKCYLFSPLSLLGMLDLDFPCSKSYQFQDCWFCLSLFGLCPFLNLACSVFLSSRCYRFCPLSLLRMLDLCLPCSKSYHIQDCRFCLSLFGLCPLLNLAFSVFLSSRFYRFCPLSLLGMLDLCFPYSKFYHFQDCWFCLSLFGV